MKKLYIIAVVAILFCFGAGKIGIIQQQHLAVIAKKNVVGVDYTQDANCMGAWAMSNNGGNETDLSGEGETLTQTSGTIPTDASVPSGYAGTSRLFVQSDTEYLMHADDGSTDIGGSDPNDQELTICAWVNFTADPGDDAPVVRKYLIEQHRQYQLFQDHSESAMSFRVSNDGDAYPTVTGTTDVAADTGTWYHVCGVSNDVVLTLYVNGSSEGTPQSHTSGIYNGNAEFHVGVNQSSRIKEVIVFDRELLSAEILNIYNNGMCGDSGACD
jgi:hypothetical protein